MEEAKKNERSFELRSEKVRSIVGQIPSSLVRHGITAISAVVVCLLTIAYLIPYKQVYTGTAVIRNLTPETQVDTSEVDILAKFNDKRPNTLTKSNRLELQSGDYITCGSIVTLSTKRDTLGRQTATARFSQKEIIELNNCEVDFILTTEDGTILKQLMKR